ncbi:MAG: CPBP family intramembrane metalloprotease [Oscillospiraceae bacterium]|jgi:membrane protease YdiL (CAAX protease family)|nr:CPBP family intramembrane metalloprotease [Oscillospiraceae bacterium]
MDELIITQKPKRHSYKTVCAKLGFIMCVYYICRITAGFTVGLIHGLFDEISETAFYISQGIILVMLIYMVPLLVAAILFKSFDYYSDKIVALYKKPGRLAKKLGTFPAVYGLGYGTALLTMLLTWLLSRFTERMAGVEEFFQPTALEPSNNIVNIIMMVFMLVVIAPVFEEFLCRGIMYDALKPYGTGVAIIISSVLFGLMHGTLYMLFYTTAIGFALGYIRYATNSLFIVTVLHAIINAVAAGLLVMTSLTEITMWENKLINTFSNIYQFAALMLIIIGIIAFFMKIPVIRRYKIENAWNEINGIKKIGLFFISVPVLIMLVFAFDEHANNMMLAELVKLIRGGGG